MNRKTAKRKRVAAETNRIRAQKKSKASAASSIIGRKPVPKKREQHEQPDFTGFSTDPTEGNATFLDDPIPEYIILRHKTLKKLHEAGLRVPPSYEDIDFSDSDSEQESSPEPEVEQAHTTDRVQQSTNTGDGLAPELQSKPAFELAPVEPTAEAVRRHSNGRFR